MGIKNSKQSVNISTIPKKDAKKSEVIEKGDISEKSDADNLKGLVEEVSGENLEPVKEDDLNGEVVPVLKVEDVEVTGAEEGDEEVPKPPTMSKIASMKRDLSFGRLQKMFSREAKSEPQQDADKVADEPSELSGTDEKLTKAEEAMGEEVKSEEAKGEDVESRLFSLKKSLMKMFTRESESEGATSPTVATATSPTPATTATENEGAEEKGAEEGSLLETPAKVSSLKKRLSFKAMRSKFSKEKKETDTGEDNAEEKTEEHVKMGDENEEGEEKKGEEGEIATDETKKELDSSAKVNQDEEKAEVDKEPAEKVSVLPGELKQSFADAVKQPEKVAQELSGSESSETGTGNEKQD